MICRCPYRLVVRTSRRGRDNPGSTPGVTCMREREYNPLLKADQLPRPCVTCADSRCFPAWSGPANRAGRVSSACLAVEGREGMVTKLRRSNRDSSAERMSASCGIRTHDALPTTTVCYNFARGLFQVRTHSTYLVEVVSAPWVRFAPHFEPLSVGVLKAAEPMWSLVNNVQEEKVYQCSCKPPLGIEPLQD